MAAMIDGQIIFGYRDRQSVLGTSIGAAVHRFGPSSMLEADGETTLSDEVLQGWVEKQGRKVRNWKKRYMQIMENTLRYSKSEALFEKGKFCGSLSLSEAHVVRLQSPRGFAVIVERRALLLRFATEAVADRWFKKLELTTDAHPPRSLRGWLLKRGLKFGSWKKRHFTLEGDLLLYYPDDSENSWPLNALPLNGCHLLDIPQQRYNRDFCFLVKTVGEQTQKRDLILQADSEAERNRWRSILMDTMRRMSTIQVEKAKAAQLELSTTPTSPSGVFAPSVNLPEGWEEHCTDAGQRYYFNTVTMESHWEEPTMPAHAAPGVGETLEVQLRTRHCGDESCRGSVDHVTRPSSVVAAALAAGVACGRETAALSPTVAEEPCFVDKAQSPERCEPDKVPTSPARSEADTEEPPAGSDGDTVHQDVPEAVVRVEEVPEDIASDLASIPPGVGEEIAVVLTGSLPDDTNLTSPST